jgi:hypothetical protein
MGIDQGIDPLPSSFPFRHPVNLPRRDVAQYSNIGSVYRELPTITLSRAVQSTRSRLTRRLHTLISNSSEDHGVTVNILLL